MARRKRGLPPDGEKIALLRKKKGLTQAQLAQRTQLNLEDIQRMESGQYKSLEKLQLVAMELLGTTDVSGIIKNDNIVPETDASRITFELTLHGITVKVSFPPSEFDETKATWLRTLVEVIAAKNVITIKSATPGESTLVELEMTEPDIDRLIKTCLDKVGDVSDDKLALLQITQIRIGWPPTWFATKGAPRMMAYLELEKDGSVQVKWDEEDVDHFGPKTSGWTFSDYRRFLEGFNYALKNVNY